MLSVLAAIVLLGLVAVSGFVLNLGRIYESSTNTIDNAFPEESLRPPPWSPPPQSAVEDNAPPPVAGDPAPAPAPGEGAALPDGNGTAAEKAPGRATQSAPVNILVLGSDSRSATLEDAAGGKGSNQRADTIMLLHIPGDRSKIYSISLMRDLWVDIPGRGTAKINAAMAFGGVPLMVRTVESIFKQRVDHVALIDFEGFKGLTDSLGGVRVDVTRPFTSYHDHLEFKAGPTTLDGEHALAFVRERYAYSDGDYQRVRNQQAFLKAALGKLLSAGTLTNPVTLHRVVSSTSPYVSVDSGLNAMKVAALAVSLRDLRGDDAILFTLPTAGVGTSRDGQSIVLPNPAAIKALAGAMAADSVGKYVAANHLEGGN